MKLYCTENGTVEKYGRRGYPTPEEALHCQGGEEVLEFDVDIADAVVGEGAFEQVDEEEFVMSFLPVAKYRLGSFVRPVYFAPEKTDEEALKPYTGENTGFKLFDSSDRFYIECLCQEFRDRYPNFDLYAIRNCLEMLVKAGRMKKSDTEEFIIYENTETGETIPVCKRYIK